MDRVTDFFLRRLRYLSREAMLQQAVRTGLVDLKIKEVGGYLVRRFEPAFGTGTLTGNVDADMAMIRSRFGTFLRAQRDQSTGTRTIDPFIRKGVLARAPVAPTETDVPVGNEAVVDLGARRQVLGQSVPSRLRDRRAYAISLIRNLALPPKVTDVAGCLLLSRAIDCADLDLTEILSVLRQPTPIISIHGPVVGLEDVLIRLIEAGAIIPEKTNGTTADYIYEATPFEFVEADAARKFVYFLGNGFHHSTQDGIRARIGDALDAGYPIVSIAEKEDKTPEHIRIAADLKLFARKPDWRLIADLIDATTTISNGDVLEAVEDAAFEPKWLTMNDLALSIRSGRSLAVIIDVMGDLAERNRRLQEAEDEAGGSKKTRSISTANERPSEPLRTTWGDKKTARDNGDKSAVDLIMPEGSAEHSPDDAGEPVVRPMTIETLAGYGDARPWALDLKADLALYSEGGLAWSEMSTKLLLSGPPGTGKTLFARALCNSLQIPMLATSVSTWLQGGYLNSVLNRIAGVFDQARKNAPCILFIDEIDGIGKRPPAERDYGDYWTAVVNKLLQMLDGAIKTEGIIVIGATNRPEQIDEAIRRSGRLEKHVVVPKPDIRALADILIHHLRDDVVAVLQTTGTEAGSRPPDDGLDDEPSVIDTDAETTTDVSKGQRQ